MPVFPVPDIRYAYNPAVELARLRRHRTARRVPRKGPGRLLLGSWNIANLGAQLRRGRDLALVAEILGRFDVVAIQECREDFDDLYDLVERMGPAWRVVMSDAAGNNERLVFVYDGRKLDRLDEIGEIAFPPSRAATVRIDGVAQSFGGFDRNPYLVSFRLAGTPLSVQLVNVHQFYGSPAWPDVDRRALETLAWPAGPRAGAGRAMPGRGS